MARRLLSVPDANSRSPRGAGVLLVIRQTHMPSPLLPVDLLRIPIFALSISTSIASFCGQMLAFVSIPFYLESHFGYSAVEMGLLDHALADRGGVRGAVGGTAGRTLSGRTLGGIGLALFACGLGTLALMPANPTAFDVIWRMALAGAGFGLFQTPNNRTMIAAAPRERSGGASGMLGTARLLGQTTGAALVALFLARYPLTGHADLAVGRRRFCPARGIPQHAPTVARRRAQAPNGCGFATTSA